MKAYTEYMNTISADAALHEAILRRAAAASAPRRYAMALRFAAAAAVLVLCILAVPPLVNHPAERVTLPHTSANIPPDGVETLYPATEDATATETATQDVPLQLNADGRQVAALIYIPGHFWYNLTDAQYAALLPDFSFPVDATVHYRGDGSVFDVVLYELENGETAMYNEYYTRTEIILAPDKVDKGVVYDFTPVVTSVNGIEVVAGVLDWKAGDSVAVYTADFTMDGIAYAVRIHDNAANDNGTQRLTALVNKIICFGAPDMTVLADPVIPALRDDVFTLAEAYADPDFGFAMPVNVPEWLSFEDARRFVNQIENSLSVYWHRYMGYDYVSWTAAAVQEFDRDCLVAPAEVEKYDLALYPIPRADSIPDVLWDVVNHPVFRVEELTLDMIYARAYRIDDAGDTPGWRMDFNVLMGDTVVRISSKGASPEEVWAMLAGICP